MSFISSLQLSSQRHFTCSVHLESSLNRYSSISGRDLIDLKYRAIWITLGPCPDMFEGPLVGRPLARFPDPLAFGSGSGLQCVYTVVISLWGTPAAKFVLKSSKMLFYWIAPCIRKPQAEFHKISTTHVSPSSHWMPSTQSPLLIGTKDSKDLSI